MRYLVNLCYDGSKFYGYQVQNNNITVEGELEKCLSKIFNKKINSIGASRTDKGVHAINQYAMFDGEKVDTSKLKHSLNSMINEYIHIKDISVVKDSFHARYDVKRKEYIYKINMGEYNPIEKDYTLQYCKTIDKELIDKFISLVSGKHNFKSFTSDKDKNSYERDVTISYKIQNNILIIKLSSSGFLRYMIRNIIGLLLDINDSKKELADISKIFKEEDRCICGRCASGCGLYLNKVYYK